MLNDGVRPPADAVRAEEFINYFDYGHPGPASRETPFKVTTELAPAPWNAQAPAADDRHQGLRRAQGDHAAGQPGVPDRHVRLDGFARQAAVGEGVAAATGVRNCARRTACRSWSTPARPGWCCRPTPGDRQGEILAALDRLEAGGSTNGGDGIRLAYAMAKQAFVQGGVNRVILATDGDFNVGTVDTDALETLVGDQRKSGIALTTLGFGQGNYNDAIGRATGRCRRWQPCLHRQRARGAQGAGRGNGLDPDDDRPRREGPGRVQPGAGRRVPPDRLREPRAAARGLRQRQGRRRRHRRRATKSPRCTRSRRSARARSDCRRCATAAAPTAARQWRRNRPPAAALQASGRRPQPPDRNADPAFATARATRRIDALRRRRRGLRRCAARRRAHRWLGLARRSPRTRARRRAPTAAADRAELLPADRGRTAVDRREAPHRLAVDDGRDQPSSGTAGRPAPAPAPVGPNR